MVDLATQVQRISFAKKVSQFMDTHCVGITIACCHLNTYPNDTHYCSGHGLFGDNGDTSDCEFKEYCKELAKGKD